ncbi:MAG: aminotransferase class III-fold pyridoxal phosphate-dependent enzyme, partial [Nitrospirae bacterium]|nr:aminotransferase class III-fold pyridoxal phosphate-dependent enzyme [Nitrospirota bacterium]
DIESLHKIFKEYPDYVAAVIMEPMNNTEPLDGFLEKVKELTRKNGAVFIFDETITGFRYANGGAQEYFNVIPDLATFGKGLANGYPVSAIAGRADIMRLMEDVFFSFTFGGETLSLAAALAAMTKLQKEPVVETLWSQGSKVVEGTNELIKKYDLQNILSVTGKECWSFLVFKDSDIYSQHSDEDIGHLLNVYDDIFALLKDVVENGSLKGYLNCEPLVPLFKVR